jgi:hypothetical protein
MLLFGFFGLGLLRFFLRLLGVFLDWGHRDLLWLRLRSHAARAVERKNTASPAEEEAGSAEAE